SPIISLVRNDVEAFSGLFSPLPLQAQRRELYVRERYGKYSLSDPFLALQRDSEAVGDQKRHLMGHSTSNPLVVLKLVVNHCRKMQDKMLAQLAAAESRHRRVIADLEEEKRRHAEDTAEGDDVTYILEKERERLQQQLEFERSQARRSEKDQRRLAEQLDEERAQSKQVTSALAKECKWAGARALEEGHRLAEAGRKLEKEVSQALQQELEAERGRALRMEARVEEQLAEFDTEREQLRSRLKKEEAHCCLLQREVRSREGKPNVPSFLPEVHGHPPDQEADGAPLSPSGVVPVLLEAQSSAASSSCDPENSGSSPPPAQRPSPGSPGSFQSSYQAGIHQRFHAARHKFQGTVDPDLPATPVKQLARSTVTQVLSRFTTAQQGAAAKPTAPNNSPFGTDYRNLSAPLSPVIGRAQGVRSPTIPRAERGNPPPIPPKKPGLAQAPASPSLGARSAALYSESPIAASCGLTSSQEGVKGLDRVVSSN
uniref:CTTNBP2 N-terminal like n=1 Tax=Gadus morhua TaxID=8049 RepID=A0A8C4Z6T2_GADMO